MWILSPASLHQPLGSGRPGDRFCPLHSRAVLGEKLNKTELSGFQYSARGGSVKVRLAGDRVILGGHAVEVFSGKLLV